jgi:hypothetical protein
MAVYGIISSIAQFVVKCPKLTGNQVCTLFTVKRINNLCYLQKPEVYKFR